MAKILITQAILSLIIFTCACIFNNRRKYIRFSQSDCRQGVLNIYQSSSNICCEPLSTDIICNVTYDPFNYALSSYWAWIIALIPLLCTTIGEMVFSRLNAKRTMKRLFLYLLIMAFRLIVLFLLASEIQVFFTERPKDCWYKALMRNGKCKSSFDFSDHIVLFLVHYLLPASLELEYIYYTIQEEAFMNNTATSISHQTVGIAKYIPNTQYWLTILTASAITFLSYRGIYSTTLLFHTPLECLVAMVIGLSTILLVIVYLQTYKRKCHIL